MQTLWRVCESNLAEKYLNCQNISTPEFEAMLKSILYHIENGKKIEEYLKWPSITPDQLDNF